MKQRTDDLEDYPLAKAYRWTAPKRDTGGILYLYPPISKLKAKGRAGSKVLQRQRVDSLNPYDLNLSAFDGALDRMTHN